jgi:cell division protein FtsQ
MSKAPAQTGRRVVRAVAAVAVIALLAVGIGYGVDGISSLPIKRVFVAGEVQRIARADLDAFVQGVQGASASGASLAAVREAARRIPWVRDAAVRRRFPDAVEVTFQTHEPLARWDDGALVSARGEVFNAEFDGPLPRFTGPEGSAKSIAREYPAIVAALAPISRGIAELRLSRRGAWQVVLEGEGALLLDLGRGDIHARLARFVAAWPQIVAHGVETRHADLRYASGFALTLSPLAGSPTGRGRQR